MKLFVAIVLFASFAVLANPAADYRNTQSMNIVLSADTLVMSDQLNFALSQAINNYAFSGPSLGNCTYGAACTLGGGECGNDGACFAMDPDPGSPGFCICF